MFQAMPGPKRLYAILIGISIPQLATPLARALAPALLEWGDWRMAYFFEFGTGAADARGGADPAPAAERAREGVRKDRFPDRRAAVSRASALLCAALGLGRTLWWTEEPWIGWALIGAIVLITAGIIDRASARQPAADDALAQPMGHHPHCAGRDLHPHPAVGADVRSIGLLTTLGMGVDQFQTLYIIVTLASLAGLHHRDLRLSAAIAGPADPDRLSDDCCRRLPGRQRNQPYAAGQCLSQPGADRFGALLFIGPAMAIGDFPYPAGRARRTSSAGSSCSARRKISAA